MDIFVDQKLDNKRFKDKWLKKVKSIGDFIKKRYDQEARLYIKMLRHEMNGVLPERLLKADQVDVNVVYPVVKALIPRLYFRDPKVYLKSLQEEIINEITDEQGQPVIDPITGVPQVQRFDGPKSAHIFQNAINHNMDVAKIKQQVKMVITDAHLGFFGALKLGFGNDQGVASMGDGAPPSLSESVFDDMAYAIRIKPWCVIPDMTDFYNQGWRAIKYSVNPLQLKQDKRLFGTEQIKGTAELDKNLQNEIWKYVDQEDMKQTEYYEITVKPSAEYPNGLYLLASDEVKDDFLYQSEWPYIAKEFNTKLLYFNPDPEGGLPTPEVRYYAGHQKAKVNMRNAEYEYVQRTMPLLIVNGGALKDSARVEKELTSGNIPRVVIANQPPDKVVGAKSFASLSIDFRAFDANLDNDIARVVGIPSIVTPSQPGEQLATGLKISASSEEIRQNEKADIITDFMQSITEYWGQLYQQFAGPENFTPIDGETFPTKWSREQIQGKFHFKIKPFSMAYEDPTILRRQWMDLFNLLSSPEAQVALAQSGSYADLVKILKRILETFDERDVETFVRDAKTKPEEQVADAIQENQLILQGQPQQVLPTDNHKLHILVHALGGEAMSEHIMEHQQAMAMKSGGGTSGGGNIEPSSQSVNGVATSQDLYKKPLNPSSANQANAVSREAGKTV